MAKRARIVTCKQGELKVAWGKAERSDSSPNIQYAWGGKGSDKSDARIVSSALEECKVYGDKTLREELVARGYDISTLCFTISKLKNREWITLERINHVY